MAYRRREVSHRTERRNVADPRIRTRANRKQRHHHAGDALNGGTWIHDARHSEGDISDHRPPEPINRPSR